MISLNLHLISEMSNLAPNRSDWYLTLRKIAIWLSKKLPKTWHFFQKNCQKFSYFKKNCHWQFCWKNDNLCQFFGKKCQVLGNFFDSQMAIFRRVMCQLFIIDILLLNLHILAKIVATTTRLKGNHNLFNPWRWFSPKCANLIIDVYYDYLYTFVSTLANCAFHQHKQELFVNYLKHKYQTSRAL